ncbi:CAP domain-containing protein [Cupriavidus sp. UYPR2.512]|uniref:CAP domain-containing protein n=1 Tax=Cupriavidus sp. UYPR2.512 TaxID=1080187 RepID=UPI00036D6FA3|nr:CAP domain-containing protein [Cupriavidus sp. UYPR2.512]
MKTKLALSVVSVATLLALAACGGGGDDGGSKNPTTPPTTPTAPQDPTSVPPATSAPAATYPSEDQRLAAYDALNAVRLKLGVGALKQDAVLDIAADKHLNYMKLNGQLTHLEAADKPGFTGVTPYDQVVAAGGTKDQWIGQVASGAGGIDGKDCANGMKRTVYHLQGITSNQETVGISVRDNYCVINFGIVTGAKGGGYGLAQWGGQQMATNAVAYYPADNDSVVGTFTPASESPNPAPDLTLAGHPIMFRVPAPDSNDILTVSSFALVGQGGATVPARVLVSSKAKAGSMASAIEDANLYAGVVFLLPTQPLSAGTYTATIAGARNGVAISKSWSFTAF